MSNRSRFPLLMLLSVVVGCGGIKTGVPQDSGDERDEDGDGSPVSEDCDDTDPSVAPGLPEVCDGKDNDCNAQVDEADPGLTDGSTYYVDVDGDGYGATASETVACEAPSGSVTEGGDCDDSSADVSPAGVEDCTTAADDDCSGSANDEDALSCTDWFVDGDDDNHGATDAASACLCFPEGDYQASVADDCDDSAPDVNPEADEVCNDGIDNDCDEDWDECRHSRSGPVHERGIEVYGLSADAETGPWISAGPDTNGDGKGDILISGPGEGGGGRLSLITAAPTTDTGIPTSASATIEPDVAAQMVRGVIGGDMDGDGTPDIAAFGSTPYDNYSEFYVFSGIVTGSVDPGDALLRISPTNESNVWGDVQVADIDGNGEDEAVVLYTDGSSMWAFGNLSGTAAVAQTGSAGGYTQIGDIGDVTGDGLADLMFGNPDNGGSGTVGLWISDGDLPSDLSTEVISFAGMNSGDLLGTTMAPAGDLTGDGYEDYLVTAPYHDTTQYRQGAVYVFAGGLSPNPTAVTDAEFEILGEMRNDNAGAGAAGIGDMDGDGHLDLAVGSTGWDTSSYNNTGAVYFLHGPFSGSIDLNDERGRVDGGHSSGLLGTTIISGGDLDDDGFNDVLMGEPGNDTGAENGGAVWIMFGAGL